MSKKTLVVFSALVLVSMMLSACAPAASEPAEVVVEEEAVVEEETVVEEATEEEAIPELAFIPSQLANPSQAFAWKMFQKYCPEYGFECLLLDAKGDAQEQTKLVNNAVVQGVDVMIVNPADAVSLVPALDAAKAAGVYVGLEWCMPAYGEEDSVDFWVCNDNIGAGEYAVDTILELFPDGATGVEVGGGAGHDSAIRRHDGFTAAIEGKPITVLDYQNPQQWDAAQAQAIMEDMITKYGDEIEFVFCHWDNGASGVINALKAKGGMDDVLIVAVDGNKTGWKQAKSWNNYVSIAVNVETMVKDLLELSNCFLNDDSSCAIHDNILPYDIYTKDTVDNFPEPEW